MNRKKGDKVVGSTTIIPLNEKISYMSHRVNRKKGDKVVGSTTIIPLNGKISYMSRHDLDI